MASVSYAQNFEDVMLWRALKHLDTGFYVDVGASDPVSHSVTKLFYDAGWRGINVEPNSDTFKLLQEQRVRDININVAVGDQQDELYYYISKIKGRSTLDKFDRDLQEKNGTIDRIEKIEVRTLKDILDENIGDTKQINFLKVDVEGFEPQVLKGNDWKLYRPWIVIIEAMLPDQQVEAHESSEAILIEAQYHHVYSDGLNRFYVANEHSELDNSFCFPPNVFDKFVRASEVSRSKNARDEIQKIESLKSEISSLNAKLDAADTALNSMADEHGSQTQQLNAEIASLKLAQNQLNIQLREQIIAKEFEERLNSDVQEKFAVQRELTRIMKKQIKELNKQSELDAKTHLVEIRKLKSDARALKSSLEKRKVETDMKLEAENRALRTRINQIQKERDVLKARLNNILASRSWKITKPIRATGDTVKGAKVGLKSRNRKLVAKTASLMKRNAVTNAVGRYVVNKSPAVHNYYHNKILVASDLIANPVDNLGKNSDYRKQYRDWHKIPLAPQLNEFTCRDIGYVVDFEFVLKLRQGHCDDILDAPSTNLEVVANSIYYAFLRRLPGLETRDNLVNLLAKKASCEEVVRKVKNSVEYKSVGFRSAIQ